MKKLFSLFAAVLMAVSVMGYTLPTSTMDLKTITASTMGTWADQVSYYLLDDYLLVSAASSRASVSNQTWITHTSAGNGNSNLTTNWVANPPFKGCTAYTNQNYVTIQSGRNLVYRIKNCKSVKIFGKNNSTSKYLSTKIFEVANGAAAATPAFTLEYKTDANTHVWSQTLDPTKEYVVDIEGVGNSNSQVYELAFERNVEVDPRQEPQLRLSATEFTAHVGDTEFAEPTVYSDGGYTGAYTYSSSKPEVAAVDAESGEVTILASGKTIITVAVPEGDATYKPRSISYNISVLKVAPVGATFYESFDQFEGQGGNDGIWSNITTTPELGTFDRTGWTTEGLVLSGYQCASIRKSTTETGGTDKNSGLTTPAFGVAGKGHVQFDAESWGTDGAAFYVDIVGGGTWIAGDDLKESNISNNKTTAKIDNLKKTGTWTTYDLEFEGLTATSKLRFYAPAGKRAFLDEVAVWVEPKKWDGTVVTSLDDKTVHSVADFEEMTIKLNGATIELSDEIGGLFLGNEDGSELYAVWNPAYNEYSESLLPGINCTYVMDGDEVTLSGWYSTRVEDAMELVPIPETATEIYLIDYSTFIVDGEYIYISDEDEEWGAKVFAYEAPTPTTYTVTYTVTGFVEDACLVEAGYYNELMTVSGYFEEGENTIPENVRAYVSTVVVEGYVVKVKVNGEAVTLTNGQWYSDGPITEDMTIEVVFRTTATAVENIEAVKATKVVKNGQVIIIRDSKTYNVMGMQL